MAKIDYLKEKADKLKIVLRFLLNIILTIMVGTSGVIYALAAKSITLKI